MQDVKASRGFGCEVRTIWGRTQQFESIGICVMSLAHECEVRVPLLTQWFRVMVKKKKLSHRFCRQPCCGNFLLIFETFLVGGGLYGITFIGVM